MYNASYLIRSRHAIYYFRYPLPQYDNKRVSISLKTRCPREALRLSKALEYHAFMVMNNPEIQSLDYVEVKEILRNHFAEVLERMKRTIDKDGALSVERVEALRRLQNDATRAIAHDQDEFHWELFDEAEMPEELSLDKRLRPIAERHGISLDQDSKERTALRREYKHALNGYVEALLAYNDSAGYYDYSNATTARNMKSLKRDKLKLACAITEYLEEDTDKDRRGYDDKRDCLHYLLEVFDHDSLISDINHQDMRKVKGMLLSTPKDRSKKKLTRGLPLQQQIEVRERYELDTLSDSTAKKYLRYMNGLFLWAQQHKYIDDNPCEGVTIKVDKNKVRRRGFDRKEVAVILEAVKAINTSNSTGRWRYWSVLLYVYTGARLNEIASLTPDDVIKDDESGIYYIRITDEEESKKKVKTIAAKRIVPLHPKLIELGFLDYVDHARSVITKRPMTTGYPTRLLYDLTYTSRQWGRKISRWCNDRWLKGLGLKEDITVLHSLRHSFITYLHIAGVSPEVIKSMAGHEQGTVTFGVYTHFGVEHLPQFKEAIEKLGY